MKSDQVTGDTVTVGCKLPHGLWMEVDEPGKPTIRMKAKGCNSTDVIGGFGLTENVPNEFWEKWLATHKDLKFVRNEQIWAYRNRGGANSKAMEMAEIKHGMEPLDPSQMPAGLEKGSLE